MAGGCQKTHSVGKGETFETIAKRYRTTVEQLQKDNPELDVTSSLPPGIEIKIGMAKYHCDEPNAVPFFSPEEVAKNPNAYELCPMDMISIDPGFEMQSRGDEDFASGFILKVDDEEYVARSFEFTPAMWVRKGDCKSVLPRDLDAALGLAPSLTLDEWLFGPRVDESGISEIGPNDILKESELLE